MGEYILYMYERLRTNISSSLKIPPVQYVVELYGCPYNISCLLPHLFLQNAVFWIIVIPLPPRLIAPLGYHGNTQVSGKECLVCHAAWSPFLKLLTYKIIHPPTCGGYQSHICFRLFVRLCFWCHQMQKNKKKNQCKFFYILRLCCLIGSHS